MLAIQQVNDAGGDAQMMYQPKMSIKGNSHMLMHDTGNSFDATHTEK